MSVSQVCLGSARRIGAYLRWSMSSSLSMTLLIKGAAVPAVPVVYASLKSSRVAMLFFLPFPHIPLCEYFQELILVVVASFHEVQMPKFLQQICRIDTVRQGLSPVCKLRPVLAFELFLQVRAFTINVRIADRGILCSSTLNQTLT